ncbi:MAG: branched-chain amino acid ABC transporter permease [Anaerolineales bacterium]|nr:branched-chain amino acid ABC transporter permease [Anaerolineales bacterium]
MLISTIFAKRKLAMGVISATLLVLLLAPQVLSGRSMVTLLTILMYVILTLSWTLFSGPTRLVSLATAALFGMGVYTSAAFEGSLPLPAIVVIGALLSAALAILIGVLTLRLRGVYFILFTFGVSALVRNVVQYWEARVSLTVGRHVPGVANETLFYYAVAIFALTLLTAFLLRDTSFGMALVGIGDNEEAAEHIGIDVTRAKVVTFAGSAVFMGAIGAVMASRFRYIEPGIAFNPLISFLPVLMAIFGGVGRLWGPILGAVIFTLLQELLITEYPYVYLLLFGLTLIIVIAWLPGGLAELTEREYYKLKGRYLFRKMWLTMKYREWRDRRAWKDT